MAGGAAARTTEGLVKDLTYALQDEQGKDSSILSSINLRESFLGAEFVAEQERNVGSRAVAARITQAAQLDVW